MQNIDYAPPVSWALYKELEMQTGKVPVIMRSHTVVEGLHGSDVWDGARFWSKTGTGSHLRSKVMASIIDICIALIKLLDEK